MNDFSTEKTGRAQVLLIVEGEKKEPQFFDILFRSFPQLAGNIGKVISYCTNIYVLYNQIVTEYGQDCFANKDDIDLPFLVTRDNLKYPVPLRKTNFTDIFLVFDYEKQDPFFSEQKIIELQNYFSDSADMGKLYINYDLYFQHYNKFLKIWKQVDKQTERQTGGFLMLYFCVFNDLPPKYLDNNTAGFRNKVVHKGHLPKQDKTLEYLEKCYMYMLEIIGLMRTKYNESMLCLALCENKIKAEKMNSALNLPVQTIAANSVINLNGNPEELNKISFETALKSYSEMNKSIENLEKIGPYNKFFEYLFKNKCKNT